MFIRSEDVVAPAAGRHALLDAAARLFADEGVDAVSIRAVNRAAGLSPAAAHYHFGSKEQLVEAVLRRDGSIVGVRIEELADALLMRLEPPTALELVRVLGTPYRELLQRAPSRGTQWLRIVAQLSVTGDRRMEQSALRPKLMRLVRRTFPDASQREVTQMWTLAVTTLIHMLGQHSVAHGDGPEQLCEPLCAFVASGLEGTLRV